MKLRLSNTIKIGFAFLTISLLWQAYNFLLPLYLDEDLRVFFMQIFNNADFVELVIGSIMALDNLLALFMIPLISKLSDNSKSKYGKRVPFIAIGIALSAVSFIFFPISREVGIIMLIFNVLVVLISMNVYRSPAVALMPDITLKPLRSQANAIINVMGGVGTGLGYILLLTSSALKLPDVVPIAGVSIIMLIVLVIILTNVNEAKLHSQLLEDAEKYVQANGGDIKDLVSTADEEDELKKASAGATMSKGNKKNLLFILLTVFLYYMGANSVETWMSLYSVKTFVGFNIDGKTLGLLLFGCLAVGSFMFMFPAASLADKYGKRNAMLAGAVIMATSNIIIAFFGTFTWWLVIPFLTSGAGMALMISNMYPITVDYAKQGDFGKYTGYYYFMAMLAQSITPALSGLLMSGLVTGSMRTLMPYSAFFLVLCVIALLFVKGDKPNKSVN